MSTKFVIFYLKWISNLCFTALQNLSEHKCADLIIMTPISPFVPSCPLKQTEQAWRGCEKGGFHFEKSRLLAGLQDQGFNSHRIPTYPLYWKALWIMFFEKWHKLHYFFAKSTAASGGARGVSWQSIHECSKFLGTLLCWPLGQPHYVEVVNQKHGLRSPLLLLVLFKLLKPNPAINLFFLSH